MVRRILLLIAAGSMMAALAVTAAFAQQDRGQLFFKVVTEGEVPQDTAFFGLWGVPNSEYSGFVQLTDLDGNGVYTAAAGNDGPLSPGEYVVRIDKGTTGDSPISGETTTIEGPETVTFNENEDTTFSTSITFSEPGEGLQPPTEGAQGEVIYGTAGSDYLTDTAGSDTIYALGSGDTISAGSGSDTLYGGTGWDYVVGGYGADILYGWTGSDWLDGGANTDEVYGWEGDDLVDGGTGDDVVYGGVGNDAVYGFEGSDDLYGWTGSDFMYSAGDDTFDRVFGGSGYDVCVAGPEDYVVGCEELYRQ